MSIRNQMRVGIIQFMAWPETMSGQGDILSSLRTICEDTYFDTVEVTWMLDPATRAAAKKIMDVSGISVAYGAQPRLLTTGQNINDLDAAARAIAIDNLKQGIDEAAELGAEGFAFLSGKWEPATRQASFDALLDSTLELCEYAKRKGVPKVALEVFDYDVDKCSVIGPAPLAAQFAQAVQKHCENFGLLMDLSHLPLTRESAAEALGTVKDYLIHAHIGNAVVHPGLPGYGDLHPRFGFPNASNGVEELAEFLVVLRDIGFLNHKNPPIVSFEVKPYGDESSAMVVANAKRTLNAAIALIDG